MSMEEKVLVAKRPYSNAMRQRQSQATRELIIRASRELAAENRMFSFTIEEVADRAGVSHRSVYRHFPTKEALLKASFEYRKDLIDEFHTNIIAKFENLQALIKNTFTFFDKYPVDFRLFNMYDLSFKVELNTRKEGDSLIRQSLMNIAPDMDPKEAERVFAITRFLISSLAWQVLQARYNLSKQETRKAVEWAITALINDVKKNSRKK